MSKLLGIFKQQELLNLIEKQDANEVRGFFDRCPQYVPCLDECVGRLQRRLDVSRGQIAALRLAIYNETTSHKRLLLGKMEEDDARFASILTGTAFIQWRILTTFR